jgi:hypothetical protein
MAIGRIPEPGTGIPESIIAAKGDLIVGTANDVPGILTVGTDGHTLVADSSTATGLAYAAPASGSFVHITTVTFTTSSSIDLSNIFSTTYENYFFTGNYVGTDDGDLNYNYRVSGSDDTTANYNRSLYDVTNGILSGSRATGQTLGRFAPTRASGSRMSITGYFLGPFLTQTKHSQTRTSASTDTAITQNFVDVGFNDATSFTGLTIVPSSGTVTGTLSFFGIRNS